MKNGRRGGGGRCGAGGVFSGCAGWNAGADKDTAQLDGVTRLEVVRMLCEAGAVKGNAKQNGVTP